MYVCVSVCVGAVQMDKHAYTEIYIYIYTRKQFYNSNTGIFKVFHLR